MTDYCRVRGGLHESPRSRPSRAFHAIAVVLLASTGISCINDSFRHQLSDDESSKPEPRLIGSWDLREARAVAGHNSVQPTGDSLLMISVEATDNPASLVYLTDEPDFGKPQELLATQVGGVSYITARDADGMHLIFRYEFLDDDTLVLVAPDEDVLRAALRDSLLSGEKKPRKSAARPGRVDWIVTSSTKQLREFIAKQGAECFPPPHRAEVVLHARRSKSSPSAENPR